MIRETGQSICRECGRDIMWAVTRLGNRMPIDPQRYPADDPDGPNLTIHRDHLGRLNARVLEAGELPAAWETRAMPHFATCPPRQAQAGKIPNVIPLEKRRREKAAGL